MTLIKPSLLHLLVGVSLTGITAGLLYILLGKDEDDVEEFVQRIKTSRSATIEVKIPKDCVGVVIGKAGANIKEIQEKSETKINFKDDEPADAVYRVCVIRGSPEAAQLAESLIHEFIANQPLIEVASMSVPRAACGRIIGKQGENVRSISRTSGARVIVDPDNSSSTEPFRRVIIKGTGDQIEIAKALIQEKVEEDLEARKRSEEPSRIHRARDHNHYLTAGPEAQQRQIEADATEKLVAVSNDKTIEVFVCAVSSPSTFWVQLYGPSAGELDFLVDNMTEYYNKDENQEVHRIKSPLKVNQMVAALFGVDDKWYRAKVVAIKENEYDLNESEAEVYYVDYGDSETLKLSNLFHLRTDFLQLKYQAIECSLANVVPINGDKWTSEAIDAFEALSHNAQWKKMTARVQSYQPGKGQGTLSCGLQAASIDLFDTSAPEAPSVADELVKQGFAARKKETTDPNSTSQCKSPEDSSSPIPHSSRQLTGSEKGAGNSCLNVLGEKLDEKTSISNSTTQSAPGDVKPRDNEEKKMQIKKIVPSEDLSNISNGVRKDNSRTTKEIVIANTPAANISLPSIKRPNGASSASRYLPAEALSEDEEDDDFDAP